MASCASSRDSTSSRISVSSRKRASGRHARSAGSSRSEMSKTSLILFQRSGCIGCLLLARDACKDYPMSLQCRSESFTPAGLRIGYINSERKPHLDPDLAQSGNTPVRHEPGPSPGELRAPAADRRRRHGRRVPRPPHRLGRGTRDQADQARHGYGQRPAALPQRAPHSRDA